MEKNGSGIDIALSRELQSDVPGWETILRKSTKHPTIKNTLEPRKQQLTPHCPNSRQTNVFFNFFTVPYIYSFQLQRTQKMWWEKEKHKVKENHFGSLKCTSSLWSTGDLTWKEIWNFVSYMQVDILVF